MEGSPVVLKPFTVPLKYREFVDHKIKQLEEWESSPEAWVTWQIQLLLSWRKRSEHKIPLTQAPPQVLIITDLILDYVSIQETQ